MGEKTLLQAFKCFSTEPLLYSQNVKKTEWIISALFPQRAFGKDYNCSLRVHDSIFLVRTINMILTQAILPLKKSISSLLPCSNRNITSLRVTYDLMYQMKKDDPYNTPFPHIAFGKESNCSLHVHDSN